MKPNSIKVTFFLLCMIFCFTIAFSQDEDSWTPVSKKDAISFNIAGTTPFVGVSYERLLTDKFNLEAGIGVFSVGASIQYFPFPIFNNKMVFHMALGTTLFGTPFDTFGSTDFSNTNYLLVGLSYFGREGFGFGLGIGPSFNYDFTFDEWAQSFYGNLKLGYRF